MMDDMGGHAGMDNIIGNMSADGGGSMDHSMGRNNKSGYSNSHSGHNVHGSSHAAAFYLSVDIPVYLFKNWKVDTITDFILALLFALILSLTFEILKRLRRNGQHRLIRYNHELSHQEKKNTQLLNTGEGHPNDPANCHQAVQKSQENATRACDPGGQSKTFSGSDPIPGKENTPLKETVFRNLSFDLGDNRWSFDISDISDIQSTIRTLHRKKIIVHFLLSLLNCIKLVIGYLLMLIVMTFNGWMFVCVVTTAAVGYYLFEEQYNTAAEPLPNGIYVSNRPTAENNGCHNAETVPLRTLSMSISTDV